ncbi:Subtilisin-like protease SBT1.4, partial [Linum perenne]
RGHHHQHQYQALSPLTSDNSPEASIPRRNLPTKHHETPCSKSQACKSLPGLNSPEPEQHSSPASRRESASRAAAASEIEEGKRRIENKSPPDPTPPHHSHPFLPGLSAESGLWINSGYGDGVIIGVLDTEIWPQHPSFLDHGFADDVPSKWHGACEACNRKLIGARMFYKGYESYRGRRIDESLGHGTHTASTTGGSIVRNASLFHYADEEAREVATKAWIAAYKICWLSGCFNFDVLAAMDQAIEDGVDVISLSVGSSYASPSYADSIAIGAFAVARRGIVVSCSAGNSGPGVHTASKIALWILTVGASVNHRL